MELSYRGSVNSWECDENDHLNVRFYIEKHWQTLCGGAAELQLSTPGSQEALKGVLVRQHVRFLQESRLATPLSGYIGVVASGVDFTDVLTELRQSFTHERLSSCLHRFRGVNAPTTDELPNEAAPRGVPDLDLAHAVLSMSQAPGYGFHPIGLGVVQADECDPGGILRIHNYMARISDSMPHLWGYLGGESGELEEGEGGAVLEYRLSYHRPLELGQSFKLMSGVSDIGPKVQRFAHLLFNAQDGGICVSAEAAGIRMDLAERRAKVLTEQMQQTMRKRLIKSIRE